MLNDEIISKSIKYAIDNSVYNFNDLDLIDVYVNSDLKIEIDNGIYVNDIDEAITLINYNSSGYCSAIFTQINKNAAKFVRNLNSKNVMVNVSSTLERQLDIKQEVLKVKNIVMTNIYD